MKVNSFIKWQLKKMLPIFLVLTLVCAATFLISVGNTSVTCVDNGYYYPDYYNRFQTCLIDLYVVVSISCLILPFFIYNYRFSRNAADTYNAFPTKENQVKSIKIAISVAFIAIMFTAIFALGVVLLKIKFDLTPEIITQANGNKWIRYDLDFSGYILAYFAMLLFVISQFGFNCFLVGRGNNLITSMIMLLAGNLFLCFNVSLIEELFHADFNIVDYFGYAADGFFINDVVDHVIRKSFEWNYVKQLLCSVIVTSIVRIAACVFCFFEKEPSGEYYGLPGVRENPSKFIIYALYVLCALICGILLGDNFGAINIIVIIIMYAGIYLTSVIVYRNFKIPKFEWIAIGASFVLLIIFTSITALTA